jgi:hypothetical protein
VHSAFVSVQQRSAALNSMAMSEDESQTNLARLPAAAYATVTPAALLGGPLRTGSEPRAVPGVSTGRRPGVGARQSIQMKAMRKGL